MNAYITLVSKVWNYAHVLRDEGIPYGDYLEQITYLLFLKMDNEREDHINEPSMIPGGFRWDNMANLEGAELEQQYRDTLQELSKQKGLLGTIFAKAQNKIQDPAKLRRLVSMIGGETWLGIGVDVKGAIYEGLLEKNAAEVKSGAGQYFTPRPLIDAMVSVMDPEPGMTISDPACGTGGFLLSAYEHMKGKARDREAQKKLRTKSFYGVDIVGEVVRLCAMNLYLHGVGSQDECPIEQGDALAKHPGETYDMVLTNPPFGKRSSYTIVGEDGQITRESEQYERGDFAVTTSNKQLNFLQHIMSTLKVDGRAAVVLPDNVLFEAGAGEKLRRRLLDRLDLHTVVRLPTGIFYKQGVKANLLFFDAKPAAEEPWTKDVWFYDFRTNQHFTLKTKPLTSDDLREFIECYNPANRHKRKESERFKRFTYDELIQRDKLNLDIFWLKDDSLEDADSLPPPDEIAAEIVENLEAALEQFRGVVEELG